MTKKSNKKKLKKSRNWILTLVILIIFYIAVFLIGSPFIKSTVINYRSFSYNYKVNDNLPAIIPKMESIVPPTFEEAVKSKVPLDEGVIGSLTIDSVGIELPIFVGVTNQNLLFGAASMYPERDALIDNIVVIGHHLGYQGQLLSPLLNVSNGDQIEMIYLGEKYTYKISSTGIIEETNLSILDNTTDDKAILTLITCDKPTETNRRFVVKSRLISTTNKDVLNLKDKNIKTDESGQISETVIEKKRIDWHFYLPVLTILITLVVGTPLLLRLSR